MNYFAHGYRFVDDPWFLAGTAVPDWLNVCDRGVRVRAKHAAPFVDDADPAVAALARGIAQHHADDAWFHQGAAFSELSWKFTDRLRALFAPDDDMRASFLGHILVELLLDAALIAREPSRLDRYYAALAALDPAAVEAAVNRMAPRPAMQIAKLLPLFIRERFLWDYADDGKLCYRLNQVLRRVRLPELPKTLLTYLPEARRAVDDRWQDLLSPTSDSEADVPASQAIGSPQ